MKKLKENGAAKILAIVLCILFGVLTIGGIVGFLMLEHLGFAENSKETAKETMFERIAEGYSLSILDNMDLKDLENSLSEYQNGNMYFAIAETETPYVNTPDIKQKNLIYESEAGHDLKDYQHFTQGGEDFQYTYDIRNLYSALFSPTYYYDGGIGNFNKGYWVLYTIRDPLLSAEECSDLFRQAFDFEERMEKLYPYVIPATVACGILTLLLFLYLIAAAGHRKEVEGIVLRTADRMPFEIYCLLLITGIGLGLAGVAEIADGISYMALMYPYVLPLCVLLVVGCGLLTLAWCMSLAVRIKAKKFWRYTLLYWLLRPFREVPRAIRENVSFTIRVGALLGLISFVQLFFIGVLTNGDGLVLFLLYKIVELPVLLWGALQLDRIRRGTKRIAAGDSKEPIKTDAMYWEFKKEAEDINHIGEGIQAAVEEQLKSERLKTELITNVSHDIKTPLTSIINYVDLMQKEGTDNPKLTEYMEVLSRQSARLKTLIENLIEASKASTGNIEMMLESCDFGILLSQGLGEFADRLEAAHLEVVTALPETPLYVLADGRSLWRILENLLGNICKYAQPGTRVYISAKEDEHSAEIVFRNISAAALNISSEQLMERFVRGDSSRSTEGNGLGLSIAESLTRLMGGSMEIAIDGDLFKVILRLQKSGRGEEKERESLSVKA